MAEQPNLSRRFSPRIAPSSIGIYPLNVDQLSGFTKDLWEETFFESFAYKIMGDPMNSIISLKWFYGIKNNIPRTTREALITLGNTAMIGSTESDGSQVKTKPALSEFVTFDCGDVKIERFFNNFLDMSPYTIIQLYLPFHGYVPLDATEVVGKTINVKYNINLITGAAVINIYLVESRRTIMTIPVMVGVDIPLNITSSQSIGSQITNILGGAGSMFLGATVSGALASDMAITQGFNGDRAFNNQFEDEVLANTASSLPPLPTSNFNRGGGLNSENGSLLSFRPSVIISRARPSYDDARLSLENNPSHKDYVETIGVPNYAVRPFTWYGNSIGKGFVKIRAIVGPRDNAFNREPIAGAWDEIERLLKGGVYYEVE